MKFSELPIGTSVLYTYQFIDSPLSTTIGVIKKNHRYTYTVDSYSSQGSTFQTSVTVMDNDDRATVIAIVSSIDDAKSRFPEYFI